MVKNANVNQWIKTNFKVESLVQRYLEEPNILIALDVCNYTNTACFGVKNKVYIEQEND